MEQIEIPMYRRVDGPCIVPTRHLRLVRTYREVVRLCWVLRKAKGLRPTDLARDFGFTRQHVSDYLNQDDLPHRRNLPPEEIKLFEDVCGNTAITQWLATRQSFTLLEELQAERMAA
jgi:hypothetical protein